MSLPTRVSELLRSGELSKHRVLSAGYLRAWIPLWNTITSRRPVGMNVFNRDWDLLIVLDACRVDALREFRSSFAWLDSVESVQSVGSMSAEWVLNTFTRAHRNEIERTALVSRNVWSNRILVDRVHEDSSTPKNEHKRLRRGYPDWSAVTAGAFGHYERVEPQANQNQRLHPESSSIPQIVTDRAIAIGRTEDVDRLIVWYRMPHLNFFADAIDWTPDTPPDVLMSGLEPTRSLRTEEQSWEPAKNGDVSQQTMWELYLQNLHLVLSYVDILLENIDADNAVVTADHGEGLGDRPWGHPYSYPLAPIKTVPWATTTATDEQTHTSQYNKLERDPLSEDRKEMLEKMGYI